MDNVSKKILHIIANNCAVEETEITPESFLEEDLNIGEMELLELWPDIGEAFGIEIEEEVKEGVESVQDIIDIVEEEL